MTNPSADAHTVVRRVMDACERTGRGLVGRPSEPRRVDPNALASEARPKSGAATHARQFREPPSRGGARKALIAKLTLALGYGGVTLLAPVAGAGTTAGTLAAAVVGSATMTAASVVRHRQAKVTA